MMDEFRDQDSDLEEGSDDVVKASAMQWASDWEPGQQPPFGVHRFGDKDPPKYRAAVFINSRPVCGPVRDRIEDCITDRRQMLIQYRRVTKMHGKKKTQPKYQTESSANQKHEHPWVHHIKDLLITQTFATASHVKPLRHLSPVSLAVKIHGTPITDRFLWSALLVDNGIACPVAESLGYGTSALNAYCASLLVEAGIVPSFECVTQLSGAVIQQLDVNRAAVLVPDEAECIERLRGKRFDRFFRVEISDETNGVFERFYWNCWASDDITRNFIKQFVYDYSIPQSAINNLELQLFSQSVAHRQKFLDAQPHIHTALQRVFNLKRQEGRFETRRRDLARRRI